MTARFLPPDTLTTLRSREHTGIPDWALPMLDAAIRLQERR